MQKNFDQRDFRLPEQHSDGRQRREQDVIHGKEKNTGKIIAGMDSFERRHAVKDGIEHECEDIQDFPVAETGAENHADGNNRQIRE